MISRDQFARMMDRDKLLYLFDEIAQLRAAGVSMGAVVEDHRKRLEQIDRKRSDKAS